jgi:hypothetical protein
MKSRTLAAEHAGSNWAAIQAEPKLQDLSSVSFECKKNGDECNTERRECTPSNRSCRGPKVFSKRSVTSAIATRQSRANLAITTAWPARGLSWQPGHGDARVYRLFRPCTPPVDGRWSRAPPVDGFQQREHLRRTGSRTLDHDVKPARGRARGVRRRRSLAPATPTTGLGPHHISRTHDAREHDGAVREQVRDGRRRRHVADLGRIHVASISPERLDPPRFGIGDRECGLVGLAAACVNVRGRIDPIPGPPPETSTGRSFRPAPHRGLHDLACSVASPRS